ncbi:MAG: hypothetical protein LCI00_00035 [Chloroflexi bacterium]|nr:hypothetical protein [Chloroflexota bacterium]MCC6893172.1 hypothetical protein [Anaerolineae bacterium]
MKISFEFERQEIDTVKDFVAHKLNSNRRFVQSRLQQNVLGSTPIIDDDKLWLAILMCLLTTQQRSGPNSPINLFLERRPFQLTLNDCKEFNSLEKSAFDLLNNAKGIRRTNKIAKAISGNFRMLNEGEWDNLRDWRDKLILQRQTSPNLSHRELEEKASNYMEHFIEFGPKQSRNFWQSLGLTRYVFVLDSRILRWLRQYLKIQNGVLTGQGLGDVQYYQFISDLLLNLCIQANVLPCVLDAAIFDSFDEGKEWSSETIW